MRTSASSIICDIFGENCVHITNMKDPTTKILMLCHEDVLLLETAAYSGNSNCYRIDRKALPSGENHRMFRQVA